MRYKTLTIAAIILQMACAMTPVFAQENSTDQKNSALLLDAIVLYVPNRVLDILDMFSLNLG